jgi:hypothetical protein
MDSQQRRLPLEDHLSDDQFKAIGLVITEWAAIERSLLYILCDLTVPTAPERDNYVLALVLATGMNYRTLLGLMVAIAQVRFPSDTKEFQKIVDDLQNSASKRDIFAHSAWSRGKKADAIGSVQLKSVGGIKQTAREYTTSEIRQVAIEMHERIHALSDFLRARNAWHDPPTTAA